MRYVCVFFSGEWQQYRSLLPFPKHGFECGDKAADIVNPAYLPGGL
jgi:hypothetical protein